MRPRILLVEDNPLNLELLRQLLEDFDLLEATDGQAGIAMATEELPDLVLMDLSLPRVDGWEALLTLRKQSRTASMPIVAVTAHALKGEEERALAAGFDGYLPKPIDEDDLFRMVHRLLPQARKETDGG